MTDHPEQSSDESSDQALRARLRGADPAASLPPVGDDRVHRWLEDAMVDDTLTESRESGTRHRSSLTWLVAAAAAAVIAGVAAVVLTGQEPEPSPPAAQPATTVTELAVPAAAPGRCLVPNAATLGNAAYALDGEVTRVSSGVATLAVTRWYAGDPTDQVRVDQGETGRTTLVGAPDFTVGSRYLLAGTEDGELMVCGFSAPWSPDLADLYTEAFG
jgi:hypothetical protein